MSEHSEHEGHEHHANNAEHVAHKEHEGSHTTHKAKPMDPNQLFMIIGALIVGLLIGGIVMYGVGLGGSGAALNVAELKPTVAAYLNNNFISPDAKAQGLVFTVEDSNGKTVGGLAEFNVYATQNGQTQLAGIVYANKEKLVIAQGVAFDLNGTVPKAIDTPAQVASVPKSDKPKVELFVMSYCPYGTQMEKAILPVVSTLQDKIDFKLSYTHFTLHGEKEDTENFRQMCIREEQGDKFLPYIQCTLDSNDPYNPGDVNACMTKLGVDIPAVDTCISTKASDYFAVDSALSQGYGVQGSPTLVINGVTASSSRSPSAVLATICSAFNIAPEECSAQLPTAQASAGFGYNASSSADAAAIQCGV